MNNWYIPEICIDVSSDTNIISSDNLKFTSINNLKSFYKDVYSLNLNKKYKFLISNYKWDKNIKGFNINFHIENLNKIFPNNNILKNNILIHFVNKEFNFYYPRIYEKIIKLFFKNNDIKIYSMNEFWIKSIIE